MLSIEVSTGTKEDSKAQAYCCQVNSKGQPDPLEVFDRILVTLGAKNAPEAARALGITKQSVYEWRKNVPGLDNLVQISKTGNASLHWLVFGEGERSAMPSEISHSFDELFEARMREIAREEIRTAELAKSPPQELGSIDEYDLATAISRNDNPVSIIQNWYAHDRLPVPEIPAFAFSGWEKMTLEQKVEEIRGVREILENQEHLDEILPSTKT